MVTFRQKMVTLRPNEQIYMEKLPETELKCLALTFKLKCMTLNFEQVA